MYIHAKLILVEKVEKGEKVEKAGIDTRVRSYFGTRDETCFERVKN